MPLIKSGTKAARDKNIAEMVRAGHPQAQAVAAAYRNAREHGANFAHGGSIYAPADAPHITPSERRSFDELLSIAQPPAAASSGKPFMPGYDEGGRTIAKGGHGGLYAPEGVVGTGWMSTKDRLYYLEGKGAPKGLNNAPPATDSGSGWAAGGATPSPPWFIRNEARTMGHQGFIGSIVPGRTDRHQMSVAGGSYVVPADVVSSIGQGNSLAGANKLGQMLRSGPYGSAAATIPKGVKSIRQKFADGGGTDAPQTGEPTDIVTAGGEYVIGPQDVHNLGGGDMDHGHSILDEMVKHVRKSTIKTLRKLPGPKGAKK